MEDEIKGENMDRKTGELVPHDGHAGRLAPIRN